jgi:hypothetical protein
MSLPLHTRAAALVAAMSTAAAVIVTVAEIGHPPPDGQGVVASLLALPGIGSAHAQRPAGQPAAQVTAAEMPQP